MIALTLLQCSSVVEIKRGGKQTVSAVEIWGETTQLFQYIGEIAGKNL